MTDYEKLKVLCDQIDSLIQDETTASDDSFALWWRQTERFLIRRFGDTSLEVSSFRKRRFAPLNISLSQDDIMQQKTTCAKALKYTKAELQIYLDEQEETSASNSAVENTKELENAVFIVHGHCESLKEAVARLVEKQGLHAIILHEQRNKAATIIEKFEANSDVGAAICLFTDDDLGRAKGSEEEKARARQNVVFETGFFMGRLRRDHVVLVVDEEVEIPSDLSGVVYTNSKNWKVEVLQELKSMGFTIDLNKAFD